MIQRASRLGITMPSINQPIHKFPDLAEVADKAGFDSLWTYEFYRNAFVVLALAAERTHSIKLCAGLATAAQRTPFEMANAIADVDEFSNGRAMIATSIGGPAFTEYYMGAAIDRPASRMKEWIKAMRLYWHHMATGERLQFDGDFYQISSPPFNPFGRRTLQRAHPTVYLGAVRPAMLRLAARHYDGILAWLLTPQYVQANVAPQLDAAAADAGRDPNEIDIASYVVCSVSESREVAMRRARIQVGCYVAYPLASHVCEQEGLIDDQQAVMKALIERGPSALEQATSDALVQRFAIAGTPSEAREQYEAHRAGIPHLILHTPYVPPLTAEESEDAFRNIVATFGPNLSS